MIINRASLNAAFTGFKKIYDTAFEAAPSEYERIAMVTTSTTSKEVYPWLGKTTRFREWLGDRVVQNLATHDFTIKNRSFENTVSIGRDDFDDDLLGIYKPVFAQLGQDAKSHPDELVFGLLKKGFEVPCYDGQPFFDEDHPVIGDNGGEVSASNVTDGAGPVWYLIDTTKMIKPIIFQKRRDYEFVAMDDAKDENVYRRKQYEYGVDCRVNVGFGLWQFAHACKGDLTPETYGAVRSAMRSIKGDNGKPLNVQPNLLVAPPSLEGKALSVVAAEKNAAGADNVFKGTAEVLTTPWVEE